MWNDLPYTVFETRTLDGFKATCSQLVAEVLAYLHVQISPISCNVVGSILQMCLEKTLTRNCRLPVGGGGGTPRPVLLTAAKKSGVPD